jgi:L-threonylcarbamoyladenylate synthase
VAQALIRALGAPIAAPSANTYQSLSPTEASHVQRSLGDRVPLILDGGPCAFGLESTVVDLTIERPALLRPGALSLGALRAVIPGLALGPTVVSNEAERHSPGQDAVHYAPRARLALLSREEAIVQAVGNPHAGLVLRGGEGPSLDRLRVLPNEPVGYGRELFSALHALDALGLEVICVEAPPDSEAWAAVADRLKRGAR